MSDDSIFISPFLNINPSLLVDVSLDNTQFASLKDPNDQFIFPEGDKHRGRFERSFSEIGSMVIGGKKSSSISFL